MAYDSTPVPPEVSAERVDALRRALASYVHLPHAEQTLSSALRSVAEEAHAKSITAEQLLMLLKHIWYALPQLRDVPSNEERVELLQRVVTICIREYYDM